MKDDLNKYVEIIDNFPRVSVAVIGDIVADVFMYGRPFKLSREAPVIVVKYEGENIVPGSAGNTANNLLKLGAKVFLIGIVGEDKEGDFLKDYFSKDGVDITGVFTSKERGTISKTRILAGDTHASKRQVVRVDKETSWKISDSMENKILDHIDEVNTKVDVWIASDYGYDIITPKVLERIKRIARGKTVVADSRSRICDFAGASIIAPNEAEAEAASGMCINGEDDMLKTGKELLKKIGAEAVIITRGNRGMTLFEKTGHVENIPICGPDEVTDVTGAGDTVTSMLALGIPAGANFVEATRLSNYAAGVVVMKNGTATVSRSELVDIITKDLKGKPRG
ncbi:MAG: bifunctional heptose 7-phosphate kinase/heptose 1-phosphate adenyltransferase [Candidatus Brocadiales bacterium]